ncbi:uncharacterized protein [Arachis hypogaea]|uniref:uncharacterized protein n=1 Tax=Arachis hypogaea TaxID=3818 RepID=UPI003B2151E0
MADNQSNAVQMDVNALANLLHQLTTLQSQILKNNTSPIQDQSSPYFIHSGENPGTLIISIVLTPNNYGSWSHAMIRALISKNKLKFIDGTIRKPENNNVESEAWERCNNLIVSWINLSLSPGIRDSIIWNNVAVDLWEELKHRYYQGDRFRIAELQEELFAIKQGDLTITDYYTRLKQIWEELNNFRSIPNCVRCAESYSCGLSKIRGYRDEDQVVRLLRGLNEQYSTVRSQIMLMSPLPDLNTVFSMLTQ